MLLTKKKIRKIMKKYRKVFETLEEYDKTREWPIGRVRIDITIDKRVLKKLKEERARTGKPISRIVEEAIIKK